MARMTAFGEGETEQPRRLVADAGVTLGLLYLIGPAATALGVAVGAAVTGAESSDIGAWVLTIVSIGALMAAFGRIVRGNRELRAAREQLATAAVTEPSRQALAEVRQAVQGSRSLALDEALDGARAALTAAGIDFRLEDDHADVPPDVEAVLAWAVREGTTNVVRHSHADTCSIRVHKNRDSAEVEVDDDGNAASNGAGPGTGLAGLRERARAARGTVDAGPRSEGGFRLRVTIPLAER